MEEPEVELCTSATNTEFREQSVQLQYSRSTAQREPTLLASQQGTYLMAPVAERELRAMEMV